MKDLPLKYFILVWFEKAVAADHGQIFTHLLFIKTRTNGPRFGSYRPAMSNPNGLLGQKSSHYLNAEPHI